MGIGNRCCLLRNPLRAEVALSVRQLPDGDDGDLRLRHRQGLDATSQPRYGVEVGDVKAQTYTNTSLDWVQLPKCFKDLERIESGAALVTSLALKVLVLTFLCGGSLTPA